MTPPRSAAKSVEPSVGGRVLHGFLGFFIVPCLIAWDGLKRAAHWVWKAPWFVQAILVLIVILCVAGGGFVYYKRYQGREQKSIENEWRRFETTKRGANDKDLLGVLDDILKKDPNNAVALSRKAAIESGEADPKDKEMLDVTIRIHLTHNRIKEAVREAKKLYALDPKDWMANCILGQDAIKRKDQPEIDKYLAAVSNPQSSSPPQVGGVLFALDLLHQAKKDETKLRTFTVNRVIPILKNANLSTIPAGGRIQFLACYVSSCLNVPDASMGNLLEFWSWSTKLADGILEDAKGKKDVQVLTQLGTLQPPLAGTVDRFQKLHLMGADDAKRQAKAVEERARKIYSATRALDPKNPAGYTGEAYALLRAGDTEGSIKMIEAGLAACDASIDLLKALTDWAKQTKQADKFLPQLRTLAGRYPQAVALWQLVAEAAEAANRRDIAIDAIQKARALLPDNQEFAWDEARLWLDAGKSQKAYELFQLIPEADRLKTPTAIRGYVRALVGAGEEKRVPDIARETMKTSLKMKDPAYALAPALGLLDSPPTLARSVLADAIADSVYTQWSNSTETLRTRAQARLRVAENAIPRWSDVKVRSAIDALDRVQSHEPKDLWAPAMSAWLRVKSRQSTDLAWREIAPIVLAESKNEALPADVLEALGCVYFARDKYDDAIRVLKRAVEMAREPASPLIALALAYEKKGDHRAGREIFLRARGQTQTDRVRDEYKAAAPLFQEKAP